MCKAVGKSVGIRWAAVIRFKALSDVDTLRIANQHVQSPALRKRSDGCKWSMVVPKIPPVRWGGMP